MRILVTGAAGFVGASLSARLSKLGHQVIGVDNYSPYYSPELKRARVKALLGSFDINLVESDISDKLDIQEIIDKNNPEAVIHLAAQAGVRLKIEETSKYVTSNLVGFSNVLESIIKFEIPNFLYASSSSVYGDTSASPYSEKELNLYPNSFYGATKLANELLAPTLIRNSSSKSRGLRFFTVYGPWGRPDMAYFRMISNAIIGSPFSFFGDGSVERDFTYIDDTVNSIIALLPELALRPKGYSDVVNLGGGRPLSMNYLLDQVSTLSGRNVEFDRTSANSNDVKRTMADANYLQTLIGTKPSIPLETGIARVVDWARNPEVTSQLASWVQSVS